MTFRPDPKPKRRPRKQIRIIDRSATKRKMARDRLCRCGCGRLANHGHHVIQKGSPHFGDDVEENIIPTYFICHGEWHDGKKVRFLLKKEEIDYVLGKLGVEPGKIYLKRFYDLEVEA